MSRRHSRVSLADRQSEALQEFESLKRKYLQYNKQIIKENSQLRVQVEELKSQLSQLYADNLTLSRSNISLEKALKRERAANKKRSGNGNAVQQADAAAVAMIQELERLRQAISQMASPPSPSPLRPPRDPTVRERPDPANRINLISKAPDFDLIQEGDSEDEQDNGGELNLRFLPLPEDDEHPRSPSPSSPLANAVASSSTNTSRRKPSRRQSGLLEPDQTRIVLPEDEPMTHKEDETDDMLVDDAVNVSSTTTMKIRLHPTTEDPPTKAKSKGKEPAVVHKLKDVTNSPPVSGDASAAGRKSIMNILAADSEDERLALPKLSKTEPKARKSQAKPPPPPTAAPPPEASGELDADIIPHTRRKSAPSAIADDSENLGVGARPARARKSVNYAEPKLNTKMRKPDDAAPVAYTYPTLVTTDHGGPSQQSPVSGRPIKPLSSLKRTTTKKTSLQDSPSKSMVDEPRPPEAGSSLSMRKNRTKVKTNPFQVQSPSLPQNIEMSDGDDEGSDEGAERSEGDDEDEDDEDDGNSDGGSDDSTASPRKSPRRSTGKAVGELKGASSSKIAVTKPTGRDSINTTNGKTTPAVSSKIGLSSFAPTSSSATTHITLPFARKPFVPTSSSAAPSSSTAASTSTTVLNSRKRKTPPTKYVYLDISDEDNIAHTAAADNLEEGVPKDRRKTINPGAVKPGKDRRLSSAT
ncbi:hypothetical protein FRB94_009091 [Tulasnella sp. JGI-2019a]|nr:hypothetical protein FRB94_009091 [Tulasnella sp. JGI-2019a]